MKQHILRKLTSIDELMSYPAVAQLTAEHDRDLVVKTAREVVDDVRNAILKAEELQQVDEIVSLENIGKMVVSCVQKKFTPSLRSAINAAGVILHTGLGRAVIPSKAIEAVNDVIKGYCNLAADIETGQRCSRDVHFSHLLCELTGAEAATIANNNAAATMLVLNSIAKGKEVIVSRGQLVEIGGSFRMPDVMEASGAILREVGTTNKTHLRDYANAINENTGAILRVHMSNYRIVGFFEEPSIDDMSALARKHGIPIIDDIGSGSLIDLMEYGLESEPMITDSIKAGVDVACFSGDKLIGGPQCGIMVGKADAIRRIKKNPLARALRVGKLDVAALEATLRLFLDRGKLNEQHPTYRMFSLSLDELRDRAQAAASQIANMVSDRAEIAVINGNSQVGSGSVPAQMIPTVLLSVRPKLVSADAFAKMLRYYAPPIFARIHKDAVLFDFRTIQLDEDAVIAKAICEIFA